MKLIRYTVKVTQDMKTNDDIIIEDSFCQKEIECPTQQIYDANYPIAESEAVPGTIEVSGQFDEVVIIPTAQDDTDAMLVDHEYRLTLLELGLTE